MLTVASTTVIAHLLPWYAPESWGGTEQYVAALARAQSALGVRPLVMAPMAGDGPMDYEHDGVPVLRWRPDVDPDDRLSLRSLLRARGVSVLHMHGWTPLCGASELAMAQAMKITTVVTVHTPSMVCATGTMLHLNDRPCDRVNSASRCARCWLLSQGVPDVVSALAAQLPQSVSAHMLDLRAGRWRRVPGARAQMQRRRTETLQSLAHADVAVAVCGWLHAAMLSMGAVPERSVMCAQGVDSAWLSVGDAPVQAVADDTLRIAFVGRWDRVKGLHILLSALRALPASMAVTLTIAVSAAADDEARRCRAELIDAMAADPRIDLVEAAPRDQVRAIVLACDVLAIPSQWLETGPLVALEARALNRFVLASDLGGLAELLHDDPGAQLVRFDDQRAWTSALQQLHARRQQLAAGIAAPKIRSSRDVAEEMMLIYEQAQQFAARRCA